MATMVVFTYLYSSFKITVPFVSAGATQVQFQPWYLFWSLPFIALLPLENLLIFAVSIAIGASLRYLPFLYFGDWSQPGTTNFMQLVTIIPILVAVLIIFIKKLFIR